MISAVTGGNYVWTTFRSSCFQLRRQLGRASRGATAGIPGQSYSEVRICHDIFFISLFIYTRPCFLQKSTDLVDCLSTERIQDLVSAKDVLARAVRVSEAPRSERLLDGQGPAENFEELLSAKELCSAQRLTSRDFQSRQAVLEKRTQRPAWAALTSRSATR